MNTRHKALKTRRNPIKEIKGNAPQQDNTKVKVQYIQNHRMIEKSPMGCSEAVKKPTNFPAAVQHVDTEEVENVEYLDESTSEEQPIQFLESCETNAKIEISKPLKKFKDTFYPNAIHCLIDLYKRKYSDMIGKTEDQIRSMAVWDEITEKMNECLFRFNRHQIKQKFTQLRQQYFQVRTLQDVDEFEYFDQLHDLYQDKHIDSIAAGFFKQENSIEKRENNYVDEVLLREDEIDELHLVPEGTAHGVVMETNADEIAHKEHEFIDMVEKELQAIDGSRRESVEEVQEICTNELSGRQDREEIFTHEDVAIYSTIEEKSAEPEPESTLLQTVIKREQSQARESPIERQSKKRFKVDTDFLEPPKNVVDLCSTHAQTQPQLMKRSHSPLLNKGNIANVKEMSLAEYNLQQERRHQEKLELFKKSLLLQERAIEMNRNLMEELIKRL